MALSKNMKIEKIGQIQAYCKIIDSRVSPDGTLLVVLAIYTSKEMRILGFSNFFDIRNVIISDKFQISPDLVGKEIDYRDLLYPAIQKIADWQDAVEA